jgi:hypothetical protein
LVGLRFVHFLKRSSVLCLFKDVLRKLFRWGMKLGVGKAIFMRDGACATELRLMEFGVCWDSFCACGALFLFGVLRLSLCGLLLRVGVFWWSKVVCFFSLRCFVVLEIPHYYFWCVGVVCFIIWDRVLGCGYFGCVRREWRDLLCV